MKKKSSISPDQQNCLIDLALSLVRRPNVFEKILTVAAHDDRTRMDGCILYAGFVGILNPGGLEHADALVRAAEQSKGDEQDRLFSAALALYRQLDPLDVCGYGLEAWAWWMRYLTNRKKYDEVLKLGIEAVEIATRLPCEKSASALWNWGMMKYLRTAARKKGCRQMSKTLTKLIKSKTPMVEWLEKEVIPAWQNYRAGQVA